MFRYHKIPLNDLLSSFSHFLWKITPKINLKSSMQCQSPGFGIKSCVLNCRLRGRGLVVFMNFFQKLPFWLFLIEEIDIYQMLLVLWKNIIPNQSYRWSKVSACVLLHCACNFQLPALKNKHQNYLLLQLLSNPPKTFRICSRD